jgi:orotate phosphoribosyltransferase
MYEFLKMAFPLEFFLIPSIVGVVAFGLLYSFLKKKRDALIFDAVSTGVGTSTWVTVAGTQSPIYYDIDIASSSLEAQDWIDKWYVDNVEEIHNKKGVDYVAFIEREDGPVGAITKKDKVSSELRIPAFIVRPRRRIRASRLKGATGDSIRGKKIVIVTDVITTGQSVKHVFPILREYGAVIVGLVTMINRGGEETKEFFKEESIEFRYAEDKLDRFLP